jgi:hypothetical protein
MRRGLTPERVPACPFIVNIFWVHPLTDQSVNSFHSFYNTLSTLSVAEHAHRPRLEGLNSSETR